MPTRPYVQHVHGNAYAQTYDHVYAQACIRAAGPLMLSAVSKHMPVHTPMPTSFHMSLHTSLRMSVPMPVHMARTMSVHKSMN